MMMQKFWKGILIGAAFLILFCSGCAAPKFLRAKTIQYPPFPDQTKKVEDPSKARIYLIRKQAFVGCADSLQFYGAGSDAAIGPQIGYSGRMHLIGEVGPGSYLCWEEKPHPFVFEKTSGDTNTITRLNLLPDHVYYLRGYFHIGLVKATPKIEILDDKEGQALVKKSQPPDDYRKVK